MALAPVTVCVCVDGDQERLEGDQVSGEWLMEENTRPAKLPFYCAAVVGLVLDNSPYSHK